MQANGLDLSIIIVSFNTKGCLEQCLSSLYLNLSGIPTEVFVVDNASTDSTIEMVSERFPQVHRIINNENLGFAKANNQAIALAQGKYFLLLNSDTIVPPRAIAEMVAFLSTNPRCGIVGAELVNADGSFQSSYARYPSLLGEFLLTTRLYRFTHGACFPSSPPEQSDDIRDVDWVGGACLMARREAVEEIGLLDEDFFMYCEEVDWCYRMKRTKKWKVCYLPTPVVHLGGQSTARSRATRRTLVYRGKLLFFRKHYGLMRTMVLRCLFASVSLTKLLVVKFRPGLQGEAASYKEIIVHCLRH